MLNRSRLWLTPLACCLTLATARADNTLVDERLIATPTSGNVTFVDYTQTQVNTLLGSSFRLTDLKVNSTVTPVLFSGAAVANGGSWYKQSQWFPALTTTEVGNKITNLGMRPVIVSSYMTGRQLRHAVVLVKDVGTAPVSWWYPGVSLTTLQANAAANNARLIDLSTYQDAGNVTQYSGVLISNTGAFARGTSVLPSYSTAQLNSWLSSNLDWSVEDLELLPSGQYLALVAATPATYTWFLSSVEGWQLDDLAPRLSARVTNIFSRLDGSGNTVYDLSMIENGMPVQGRSTVALDSYYDAPIETVMRDFGIPGLALAIVDQYGRLVYTRAYGYADAGNGVEATPGTAFRGGSISKTITAMSVMRMIQDGMVVPSTHAPLTLQTKIFQDVIFPIGAISPPPASDTTGTRNYNWLKGVTLAQVLHHTAGLATNPNPMTNLLPIVNARGLSYTPTCRDVLNYMVTNSIDTVLESQPGTEYDYANFGPCVEATVIEMLSGLPYLTYVQNKLLTPLGINTTSGIFPTPDFLANQPPNEAVAYDSMLAPLVVANLYEPNVRGTLLPGPYSGPAVPNLPDGSWAFTPVAYARLAASIDGARTPALLNSTSFLHFYTLPSPLPSGEDDYMYYGNGFGVTNWQSLPNPGPTNSTLGHDGSVWGGGGWFIHDPTGVTWVVLLDASETVSRYAARDFPNDPTDDIWALYWAMYNSFNLIATDPTEGAQYPIAQLPPPNGSNPDPYDLFSTYGF